LFLKIDYDYDVFFDDVHDRDDDCDVVRQSRDDLHDVLRDALHGFRLRGDGVLF